MNHSYQFEQFYERNKDTYIPGPKPTSKLIQKYRDILPEDIIKLWETMGFGVFEQGIIQFVNPDEWAFTWDYCDNGYSPAVVLGHTALGDIIAYTGYNDQPDLTCITLRFVNDRKSRVIAFNDLSIWFGLELNLNNIGGELNETSLHTLIKNYRLQKYFKAKDRLGSLAYGQCYGYDPIPAMGGKKSYKNLKVVDAMTYHMFIGEISGSWIDDLL